MDLTAVSSTIDEHGNLVYGTGLSIEIPEGYVGLLFPRSSIAKTTVALSNSVGVIDSGYRGEIILKFKPTLYAGESNEVTYIKGYEIGERVGQIMIMPYPQVEFEEAEALTETERGSGGYGSTGGFILPSLEASIKQFLGSEPTTTEPGIQGRYTYNEYFPTSGISSSTSSGHQVSNE
jgi:dUTP pyrophosphatase